MFEKQGWEEKKSSGAKKPRALSEQVSGHFQCELSAVALGTCWKKGFGSIIKDGISHCLGPPYSRNWNFLRPIANK